ncbi:MAG: M28 family peptidase, partial [Gemmatimonadota bacterium]
AQADPAGAAAAAVTITASDLRVHIATLAHDSMRGRDTPSPELEQTARYVAERFRSYGLLPGNGDSYLQTYPLTLVRPGPRSAQSLSLRGPEGERTLDAGEFIALPLGPSLRGEGALALLASLDDADDLTGRIALVHVERRELGDALRRVRGLVDRGANGAVLVLDATEDYFAGLRRFFGGERLSLGEPDALDAPVILVRDVSLPETLRSALAAGSPPPAGYGATLRSHADVRREVGVNTVGWIEGSDPARREEYIVFTAHMDHVGVGRPVAGDSVYNGADDDASGTSAVIELAEAFASLETPPRRSLVFLTVSGEEKGLFGSRWYAEHALFPLEETVANVNIDMIGRNWRDTVVAVGKQESTLGPTVDRIAAERAELGLAVIDDPWPEEQFYFRSDHVNFARKGVPILFLFSGTHDDYHRPSDEPDRILYEKTSRIARLVFWLGLEIADAPGRPRWDPDAYRRVVEDGSTSGGGD